LSFQLVACRLSNNIRPQRVLLYEYVSSPYHSPSTSPVLTTYPFSTEAFGLGSDTKPCCGGPRGCCGSCFNKGFDEDAFGDEEEDRARKRKKRNAKGGGGAVDKQPEALEKGMEVPKAPVDEKEAEKTVREGEGKEKTGTTAAEETSKVDVEQKKDPAGELKA
jgi:hypothetical protein